MSCQIWHSLLELLNLQAKATMFLTEIKITADFSEWQGTPTELCEFLSVEMKANALTMKLNVNAGRLYNEYGIRYENKRCHDGRKVRLYLKQA